MDIIRFFRGFFLVMIPLAIAACGSGDKDEKTAGAAATRPYVEEVVSPVVARNPEAAMVSLEEARKFKASGLLDDALEKYSQAITYDSSIGSPGLIYVERGEVYQAQGKLELALKDYDSAIGVTSDKGFLMRRIAVAQALGKRDVVERDMNTLFACCAADPDVQDLARRVEVKVSAQ